MRRIIAALSMAVACTSDVPSDYCAPACVHGGSETRVCVDSELPAAASEGVDMWSRVLCDRSLSVMAIDGTAPIPAECDVTILLALSTWPWVAQAPPGTTAFAEVDRATAWIITDVCPAALVPYAVAHELGALLGATDDLGPGVMQGQLRADCIAQHSVDEVTQ